MAVIAVLALIVAPQFANRRTQAREANLRANLKILRSAIQTYQADTGAYPANLEILNNTSAPEGVTGWNGPYISGPIPQDPTATANNGNNKNWTYSNTTGAISSSTQKYANW